LGLRLSNDLKHLNRLTQLGLFGWSQCACHVSMLRPDIVIGASDPLTARRSPLYRLKRERCKALQVPSREQVAPLFACANCGSGSGWNSLVLMRYCSHFGLGLFAVHSCPVFERFQREIITEITLHRSRQENSLRQEARREDR